MVVVCVWGEKGGVGEGKMGKQDNVSVFEEIRLFILILLVLTDTLKVITFSVWNNLLSLK